MAISTSVAADTPDDADGEAIRKLVSDYETAWSASDLDAMAALYDSGVHWVNVKGMHWQGFDQVDHAHRVFFDLMFRGVRQDMQDIESVRQAAPGVAIVVVRWLHGAYKSPGGHDIPPQQTRMTLVLSKRQGAWKILHGANIEVDAQAAAFDPVRTRPPG